VEFSIHTFLHLALAFHACCICVYEESSIHCDVCCRPFWLSPRQAVVIPVAPPFDAYAKKVSVSCVFPTFTVTLLFGCRVIVAIFVVFSAAIVLK